MTENNQSPVRIQRPNFIISDLEKSLQLYRDIFGFNVEFIKDSEPTSYSYPVFEIPREAKLRFVVLSTADAPRCLALTEVTGIKLPEVQLPRRSAIVLDIADVDSMIIKAEALGLHVYPEQVLITKDGRKGREIGVVDFDGNLIVGYTITGRVDS